MGERPSQTQQQHQLMLQPQQRPQFGVRSTAGEIVEVQGGHIVRSTGRKDRHSKVCTAKGPRDRRVRLSAHTAIQFYDVQDRLGYDRPSKAVDWLIKNAKAAIDELAELPAWHPTATVTTAPAATALPSNPQPQGESSSSSRQLQAPQPGSSSRYSFGSASAAAAAGGSSSFLPPSLDSDAIADTIKSFFPMAAAAPAATAPSDNSPIEFHNYPPDMLSRTSCQNQDLRLSLQSFTDPMFHQQQHNPNAASHHVLFSSFDAASATAVGMIPWNVAEASEGVGNVGGGGGYVFNVPLQQQQQQQAVAMQHQMMLGQVPGQFFTQRGPLQSSNPPFVRASWMDPMAVAAAAADHPMHSVIHHPSLPSIGFASGSRGSGGFSGFHIPARIQGVEEHDGLSSDRPSSDSSGSHH